MTSRKKRRAPAGVPGRWVRSPSGTLAYVVQVTSRDPRTGARLYRLRYAEGVAGRAWTREELETAGVRWLSRRPANFPSF